MVRARGGRATPSRRIILEILFDTDRHLSAEELTAAVQKRSPDVHLSTIYRNLEELQKLGVIEHAHLGHGPATYLLASHSHAHFVCDRCGKRIEARDELFTRAGPQGQARARVHHRPASLRHPRSVRRLFGRVGPAARPATPKRVEQAAPSDPTASGREQRVGIQHTVGVEGPA